MSCASVRAKTSESFLFLSLAVLMLNRWIDLKSVNWFAARLLSLFYSFYHRKVINSKKAWAANVSNTLKMVLACPLLAKCCNSTHVQLHKCSVLFCRDPLWNHSWKKEEEDDVPDSQECRSEHFHAVDF